MSDVVLSHDSVKHWASRHKRFECRGFTLVEALVVVAIIGILVAILIPTISRARELAKTTTCANNMKEIGRAFQIFANDNGGRSPGPSHYNTGSMSWPDILDAEVFGRAEGSYSIVRLTNTVNQKTLMCPNFVPRLTSVGYVYRYYAENSALGGSGFSYLPADNPAHHIATYSANGTPISYGPLSATNYYIYGLPLASFGPNQILLVEHDWSNDAAAGNDAALVFNRDSTNHPDPTAPGYSSWDGYNTSTGAISTGAYSFRHPYYERANFLCFDGHIETQKPGDDGRATKRYSPL